MVNPWCLRFQAQFLLSVFNKGKSWKSVAINQFDSRIINQQQPSVAHVSFLRITAALFAINITYLYTFIPFSLCKLICNAVNLPCVYNYIWYVKYSFLSHPAIIFVVMNIHHKYLLIAALPLNIYVHLPDILITLTFKWRSQQPYSHPKHFNSRDFNTFNTMTEQ